jgi:hypothetical protein
MIVDPDFFDHWRTRMLVDALGGDQMAPLYVMRIWAHCQVRKSTSFGAMPSAGLKALCRFQGDADVLEVALIAAGFVHRNGDAVEAPKWAEHNAKLIANWKNGAGGGRPKFDDSEPNDNPNQTQHEPTETHAEPIREEKRREELTSISNPNGLEIVASFADAFPPVPVKPDCPHQQIIALYHNILPMCPSVRDWTPARAQQLRARWNEDKSRQNLDYWRRYFEYVKTCGFLVGIQPDQKRRPFFADLEWLTKAGNFAKVRERKYE